MEDKNPSELVWLAGQSYYKKMQQSKGRPRFAFKYPNLLVNYLYFIYLSACQLQEPVEKEEMNFKVINNEKGSYIRLDKKGELVVIPIMDAFERNMASFLTSGGLHSNFDTLFSFKQWKSTKEDNLSHLLEQNFKVWEEVEKGVNRQIGLNPYVLWNMRAKSLVLHKVPFKNALTILGCSPARLKAVYKDIEPSYSEEAQVMEFWALGLFNEKLKIDEGTKLGL